MLTIVFWDSSIEPTPSGSSKNGRLRKFGLELHPDKNTPDRVRALCSRKSEVAWRGQAGDVQLLVFTHIYGRTRKNGEFLVLRKTYHAIPGNSPALFRLEVVAGATAPQPEEPDDVAAHCRLCGTIAPTAQNLKFSIPIPTCASTPGTR
jgi:hypothetical protein